MKKKQKNVLNLFYNVFSQPMKKVRSVEVLTKNKHQSIDKVAFFQQVDKSGIEVLLAMT